MKKLKLRVIKQRTQRLAQEVSSLDSWSANCKMQQKHLEDLNSRSTT